MLLDALSDVIHPVLEQICVKECKLQWGAEPYLAHHPYPCHNLEQCLSEAFSSVCMVDTRETNQTGL